eukprot:1103001-Pyramimonas_sp.AAC.2
MDVALPCKRKADSLVSHVEKCGEYTHQIDSKRNSLCPLESRHFSFPLLQSLASWKWSKKG